MSFGKIIKGVPDQEKTDEIWSGRSKNLLDEIDPFGADPNLGSLDEEALFESFRRIHGGAGPRIYAGPWVILGHTYTPLAAPASPVSGGIWWHYLNSGCAIFRGMITCVEWRFPDDAAEPDVRLVAWRWGQGSELVHQVASVKVVEFRTALAV